MFNDSTDRDPRDIFFDLWGHWVWMSAYIAIIGGSAVALTERWDGIPAMMIVEMVHFRFRVRIHQNHSTAHPIMTLHGEVIMLMMGAMLVLLGQELSAHSGTIDLAMRFALGLILVGQMLFSQQIHKMSHGESMFMQRLPRNKVLMEFFLLNVFVSCNVVAFMIMVSSR